VATKDDFSREWGEAMVGEVHGIHAAAVGMCCELCGCTPVSNIGRAFEPGGKPPATVDVAALRVRVDAPFDLAIYRPGYLAGA